MNKTRGNHITHKLKIYSNEIETTKSVKLLSIDVTVSIPKWVQITMLY